MSQSNAARVAARPAARPVGRSVSVPPRLRVVPARRGRSRVRLALSCVGMLALGLVLLLLLNISLSRGAYELYRGQAQLNLLQEQRQATQEDLLVQQAPQRLAARARKLGMVPAPNVAFVRLDDGKVLGVPKPATRPAPTAVPTARPTGTPAAPNGTPKPTAKPSKGTTKLSKGTTKPSKGTTKAPPTKPARSTP